MITTSTVRNAVIAALPAKRSLSVCRVSELPVPASSAEFAQRYEYIHLEEMKLNAARVAQMVTQQTEHFEYRERQDSSFGGQAYQYSMWDTASKRDTYKWLSPLPKEAKIKLGTAELIMPHAKIDRHGKVHRYISELNAAVLTESAVAIMPNGKKPVYDTKKSKCHKVIPLAQALELLRCK